MEKQHGQKTEQTDFTMFDSAAMLHPFLINSTLTGGLRKKKIPHLQKENNVGRVGSFFFLFHPLQTRGAVSSFILSTLSFPTAGNDW